MQTRRFDCGLTVSSLWPRATVLTVSSVAPSLILGPRTRSLGRDRFLPPSGHTHPVVGSPPPEAPGGDPGTHAVGPLDHTRTRSSRGSGTRLHASRSFASSGFPLLGVEGGSRPSTLRALAFAPRPPWSPLTRSPNRSSCARVGWSRSTRLGGTGDDASLPVVAAHGRTPSALGARRSRARLAGGGRGIGRAFLHANPGWRRPALTFAAVRFSR